MLILTDWCFYLIHELQTFSPSAAAVIAADDEDELNSMDPDLIALPPPDIAPLVSIKLPKNPTTKTRKKQLEETTRSR